MSGGRLRLGRYWDPMPEGRPVQWLTTEETARFDEVFDRAVDRCLRHGPTGIFLSGGLDSISVAAVATDRSRRFGQSPPLALSLGFEHPDCDERLLQAAIARDLGLRQHLVGFHDAVGSRPVLEQTLNLTRESAAPILNLWLPAYLALARQARLDGVGTILTGRGGDEWLCVSPYLSADLMRRGSFLELANLFGTLLRSYQVQPLVQARNVLWSYGLRPLAGLAIHRLLPEAHKASRLKRLLAGGPIWLTPDRALRAEQRRRAEDAMTPSDPPQGFYLRSMRSGMNHRFPSWQSEEEYEFGKRIGVRFLHPFMDADVVEMLCRTPPRLLNEGGRAKGLVRQKLARRFPALGIERQRKLWSMSLLESLLRREGPALADEAGDFPALSALGIVDGRATRAAVHAGLTRTEGQFQRIWPPLSLEMWTRSHMH